MTQEEKELLLRDLCARLPYGVKCTYPNDIGLHIPITEINIHDDGLIGIHGRIYNLYEIKPYLRPISSMTKEEKNIYYNPAARMEHWEWVDWFNTHHLDYRGLIPMGLALPATEDMYNIK